MASHDVLKEQLSEMGFDENKICSALKKLGEKATIESVIESIELTQNCEETQVESSEQSISDNKNGLTKTSEEDIGKTDEQSVSETSKTVEEKKVEYEERIKQRRKEREEKEKEEELKREIQRRKDGQGMGRMKEELVDLQRKRMAEDIKREKAEEKAAREAILRQIAADRAERKSRTTEPVVTSLPISPIVHQSLSQDGSCRLAIRLLDGSQLIHQFDGRESLSAVRVYVITQKSMEGEITFAMPPLQPFSEDDMQKPLNALGLCPSARVHVVKR